jgi:hypothetical protein
MLICCDAELAFKLEIDTNADALNNSKFCVSTKILAVVDSIFVNLLLVDEVYELNEDVVAKLPVLIVLPLTSGMFTLNVCASPFVNVKLRVPLSKDAVISELAVIEDDTKPNAVICELPDIVPLGIGVPKEDVGAVVVLPLLLPTQTYPFCKEAVNEPEIDKSPAVLTETPIGLPNPSSNPIRLALAVLSVAI